MISNLNLLALDGTLAEDAEFKMTLGGTTFCTFRIASNYYFKKNEDIKSEISFFNVISWGSVAESCKDCLKRGYYVRITGRLRQNRWMGFDGNMRYKLEIIANRIDIRSSFKSSDVNENEYYKEFEEENECFLKKL